MTISPALQEEIEQVAALQGISAEEFMVQTLTEKINTLQHKRIPGQYEGKLTIPKDFNETTPALNHLGINPQATNSSPLSRLKNLISPL
jgi:hypothetical protein